MTTSILQGSANKLRELSVELDGLKIEHNELVDESHKQQVELLRLNNELTKSDAAIKCVKKQMADIKESMQGMLGAIE